MEKETRVLQKDYFKMLRDLAVEAGREDLAEFCEGKIDRLNSRKANTKKAEENEPIKATIIERLTELGKAVTVTELNKCEGLTEYSNQKLSALLRQMKDNGDVVKVNDKRTTLYSV